MLPIKVRKQLLASVKAQFRLDLRGIHGAAHWARVRENGLRLAALTGADTGIAELLGETDVHIAVAHERAARIVECHALVLHCMADALDLQLMGEQDSA